MHVKRVRPLLRKFWFTLWGMFAALLIGVALLFSVVRMLLPYAADYKSDIENQAEALTGYTVEIERLEAGWHWLTPQIKFHQTHLQYPQSQQSVLQIDEVVVGIDLLASLLTGTVVPAGFDIKGTAFKVRRSDTGLHVLDKTIPLGDGAGFRLPPMLHNKTVRLLNSRVEYQDEVLQQEYVFQTVNLALKDFGDTHKLFIAASLPDELGKTLEIGVDFSGASDQPAHWQGDVYIKGNAIELPQLLSYFPKKPPVAQGRADIELWLSWQNAQSMHIYGKLDLQEMHMPPTADEKQAWQIHNAELQFYAAREKDAFTLLIDRLQLHQNDSRWAPSGGVITAKLNHQQQLQDVRLAIDFIRLEDFMPLIKRLPGKGNPWLAQLTRANPQGDIQNLHLAWRAADQARAVVLSVRANFSNLGVHPQGRLPGVSGVQGRLALHNNRGLLRVDSQNLNFDFQPNFRYPFELARLQSDIYIDRSAQAWVLHSPRLLIENAHVKTQSRFAVWLGDSPETTYIDLLTRFQDGQVRFGYRYLPVGIMPERVVQWLDKSIIDGRLPQGELELKGRLADFPFRNGKGIFRAECDFENLTLEYVPGWPQAREVQGHVRFLNTGMQADVYAGKTFDGHISDARVKIEDFNAARLFIDGYAVSSAADGLRFLRESSLRTSFEAVIDEVEADGLQATYLQLDIDMHSNVEIAYRGDMHLYDVSLHMPRWQLAFAHIDHRVRYANQAVSASVAPVEFNGRTAQALIKTDSSSEKRLQIQLQGDLSLSDLMPAQKALFDRYAHGAAPFALTLEVALGKNQAPRLHMESDLEGIALTLPSPLEKSAASQASLKVTATFPRAQDVTVELNYAQWLSAAFGLQQNAAGELRLYNADWRLQSGYAQLSDEEGMSVSGALAAFDFDAWMALREALSQAAQGDGLPPLREADVIVGDAIYLGKHFQPLQLHITQIDRHWQLRFDAPQARGQVKIPESNALSQEGLQLELAYLDANDFNSEDRTETQTESPANLPRLRIAVDELIYKDMRLNNVNMLTAPAPNGLRIHSLTVNDKGLNVRADGEWLEIGGRQQSNLHINITSDDLGVGLKKLGYADFIKDGNGNAEFNISWPAAPMQFDFGILQGNVKLAFDKGQILDIKPGAKGRMFSLISLQTIPRRLALDFKDIFSKGFRFDKMRGDFVFNEGNAYTGNFYIDGPVGRIDIKGRTGLVAKDYDQQIRFLPDLSSSLPVLGALVAGTSGGLAVILADRIARMFGKQADHLGLVEYTVRGSWEAPVIEKIKKNGRDKTAHKTEQVDT